MPPKGVFPTRENCDLSDPEEMFLWMFAAPPKVKGAPLIMPIDYYRDMSRHLYELGARLGAEPVKEYVPPSANDPNIWTSPGRWAPAGTVTPEQKQEREAKAGLARMGHFQKVEFYKALKADEAGEPLPDNKAADVVRSLNAGQKALFLRLLRDAA